MNSFDRNTPWLALTGLAIAAALALWVIASRETDWTQPRPLDVPPLTAEIAHDLGLDAEAVAPTLLIAEPRHGAFNWSIVEVQPAPGRIKPPAKVNYRKDAPADHRGEAPDGWTPVEISVYSPKYHGRSTATLERYDHYSGHTAATTTRRGQRFALPPGSKWEIEYLGNRITVRINDNGPTEPSKGPKYWLDLSGAAWKDLTGIAPSRKVARMRRVK